MSVAERTAVLLSYLPSTYGLDDPDPIVTRWQAAQAAALERHFARIDALRRRTIPAAADDTFGMLANWERILGLPVSPGDLSEESRRAKVAGRFIGRNVVRGYTWRAAMERAIGSPDWTAAANTPAAFQLTITVPFLTDSYQFQVVRVIGETITPANQELIWAYSGGFIVGHSRVGDAL